MRGNTKKGGITGAFAVPGCFGAYVSIFFLRLTHTKTFSQAVQCKETLWLFPLGLQSTKRNLKQSNTEYSQCFIKYQSIQQFTSPAVLKKSRKSHYKQTKK